MRFKLALALGALTLGGLSAAVAAQGQDNVGQSVWISSAQQIKTLSNAPVREPLTQEQSLALYPRRGPAPGVYRMRALHSGYCLQVAQGEGLDRQERLEQHACRTTTAGPLAENSEALAFVPRSGGGYTIRTFRPIVFNGREPVPGQISNCLTVAPGVVLGPARIEGRACDVPAGGDWTDVGSDGQKFMVLPAGRDVWEIQVASSNPDNPDCIAVRGGSREYLADFIRWGCNQNADQRFSLEWIAPIPADVEAPTLARSKWFFFADGHRRLSPAQGVELSGVSYATFETINDGGDYCMKRCAELGECKAWSWTAAGYAGSLKPMCQWKHDPGIATNRGPASFGKLISGIVRM